MKRLRALARAAEAQRAEPSALDERKEPALGVNHQRALEEARTLDDNVAELRLALNACAATPDVEGAAALSAHRVIIDP